MVKNIFNQLLIPEYQDAYWSRGIPKAWLQADIDAIPEMQADKKALAEWLSLAHWIPVVTKQELMGITPDWDGPRFLIPAGLVGSDTLTALPPTV